MFTKEPTVGRPRKDDLTTQIKFNVNNETALALKRLSVNKSISQAEIMRELTPIISSKSFESLIPFIALENLQSISDECWNILHNKAAVFSVSEISANMPAFVTSWEPRQVHVKYPTYKIDIFNKTKPTKSTSEIELEKLLFNIPNRSKVYATPAEYLICGSKIEKLDFPFISEVVCLSVNLDENKATADRIEEILNQNEYICSVYPAYCIRSANVEFIENDKYFRVIS